MRNSLMLLHYSWFWFIQCLLYEFRWIPVSHQCRSWWFLLQHHCQETVLCPLDLLWLLEDWTDLWTRPRYIRLEKQCLTVLSCYSVYYTTLDRVLYNFNLNFSYCFNPSAHKTITPTPWSSPRSISKVKLPIRIRTKFTTPDVCEKSQSL